MSSDAAAAPRDALDSGAEGARRAAALRLAFGVTACFAVVEALDWNVTFLAPLLAANLLVKLPRSPTLGQGLGIILLFVLSTGTVLAITAVLLDRPTVLILALTLVIYISFYAHRRGAPDLATLLLQLSAVSLPIIAVLSPERASSFAGALILAGVVALFASWAAYAAFPAPSTATADATPAAPPGRMELAAAARHALLDTLVLLPVLVWFILDATQIAVVVLTVILTVLRQRDWEQGQRAALGLILGNLIGGIAAAIVYNLVLMTDTMPTFVIGCLAVSLFFSGKIALADARAPVYAVALTMFILLLGLGITPLPGGSGEAFINRFINVLLASAYVIGGLSLVAHWRIRS